METNVLTNAAKVDAAQPEPGSLAEGLEGLAITRVTLCWSQIQAICFDSRSYSSCRAGDILNWCVSENARYGRKFPGHYLSYFLLQNLKITFQA